MHTLIILIIILLTTFCLGFFITPYLVSLSKELHLYDIPDGRKVHQLPIPRMGGIAFLPIVTITISVMVVALLRLDIYCKDTLWNSTMIQHFFSYLAGVMMLYTIGLYDDIHGVGYKVKFLIQTVSAILLCVGGLWVADFSYMFMINAVPFWIGMPVTVFFVVYVTNAMNLIDGIDGLASGLSCVTLLVITILNVMVGDTMWAMFSIAYFGVVASFFYYNVIDKNNKTFMGMPAR